MWQMLYFHELQVVFARRFSEKCHFSVNLFLEIMVAPSRGQTELLRIPYEDGDFTR